MAASIRQSRSLARSLVLFLCAALLLSFAPVNVPAAQAQTNATYVVQPGDSLFSIAARFSVSISELATINGLYDVNVVYVGQVLRLPVGAVVAPPPVVPPPVIVVPPPVTVPIVVQPVQPIYPPGTTVTTTTRYVTYVVKKGDYLSTIAARYNTTVAAILATNGIANPNLIYTGTVLNIVISRTVVSPVVRPPGVVNPGKYRVYYVQPGDNLFGIAAKFRRDVYAIAKLNNILNLNHIYSGMPLLIP